MSHLINKITHNIEMTCTIMSGIAIILGLITSHFVHAFVSNSFFILAFLIGGYFSAKEGFNDLVIRHHLNVDILMLLATIGAALIGYWLEGALLIFIFSLSESLETMALSKSKEAITALLKLTPDIAHVIDATGTISDQETHSLAIGTSLLVKKGEAIPIDGVLTKGNALIDESAVTGEPLPVEKIIGDDVIGGTINVAEAFQMTVTVEKKDSLFAKVIQLVTDAEQNQTKTASFIEKIENSYVKVILMAVPIFIGVMPLLAGWTLAQSFYRGMILLTVASPCALIASAAPATIATISRGTKNGVLFKGGEVLDQIEQLNAIVFDKTGTLTEGKPTVTEQYYRHETHQSIVQSLIKTAEMHSTHPIAMAFMDTFDAIPTISLDSLHDATGQGFIIDMQHHQWRIGKSNFVLTTESQLTPNELHFVNNLNRKGMTLIYVSQDGELEAIFGLSDQIKQESRAVIHALHQHQIRTIMITGDHLASAQYIAEQIGIDDVIADCLPQDKAAHITRLQAQYGTIGMVGDGINDAPALALANVSVAMGSGTDIAMEASDIVLMHDDLSQIPFTIRLTKQMKSIVTMNIIFSLSVIVLLILSNLVEAINLPIGVIGHEGSTILVILNGIRLLMFEKSTSRSGNSIK